MTCKKHPKYKALRKPTAKCASCHEMYAQALKKAEAEAEAKAKAEADKKKPKGFFDLEGLRKTTASFNKAEVEAKEKASKEAYEKKQKEINSSIPLKLEELRRSTRWMMQSAAERGEDDIDIETETARYSKENVEREALKLLELELRAEGFQTCWKSDIFEREEGYAYDNISISWSDKMWWNRLYSPKAHQKDD
jgi:hypothetical protein